MSQTDGATRHGHAWRQAFRRLMGVGDAGVSSLGNLATNIMAVRSLQPLDFGLFATTMLIGIIVVGVSRSIFGDPMVLMHSADDEKSHREASRRVTGAALTAAVAAAPLLALLVALVTVVSRGDLTSGLQLGGALALVSPLLVGQELMRGVAYSAGNPPAAFFNSFSWTAALVTALVVGHIWFAPLSAPVYILMWGGTAGFGLLVGLLLNRVAVRPHRPTAWLAEARSMWRKLLMDYGLTQITAEGSVVLIAMIAGAAQAGLLRTAQIPLTPVIVLTNAFISMAQPALVRQVSAGRSLDSLRRLVYRLGLAAAGGSVLLGVLVLLVPDRWMEFVVGENWGSARSLVLILSIYLGLGALSGCQGIALRALGRIDAQLRARFVLTPISLALVCITALFGAHGAAIGLLLSLVCVSLTWAWLFEKTPSKPRRAA